MRAPKIELETEKAEALLWVWGWVVTALMWVWGWVVTALTP